MVLKNPVRAAGLLLHPTSLPGPYGIGDLGPTAQAWVDTLVRAGQTWWQVLPLGPTGYGDSPYQCFSAFAGNPNLISPEVLVKEGLVRKDDLGRADFPFGHVDYGRVIAWKNGLLRRAWEAFQSGAAAGLRPRFVTFCQEQAIWLEDYALFRAVKDTQGATSWQQWPGELVLRQPPALASARRELHGAIGFHQFAQFLFFQQWNALKNYAHARGVRLIGDIPIFVASDSADVWANPDLFMLDDRRRPTVVAGVPPDYFSATGQLWGNPLYRWEAHQRTGYAWWMARVGATLELVDLIRLDHFRGFQAYWEVPADMPTAEKGRWLPGPGADLINALRAELGRLPLIAEDLGLITPDVEALRVRFQLPGMRILQFAFGGASENRFLPHNYLPNTVVYTGTHDNDTTRGWFETLSDKERDYLERYLPGGVQDISWDLIRLAWMSVANFALAPLQDVLGLGNEARMNLPGRAAGNWVWRFTRDQLTDERIERLAELTQLYQR
jgi:4-alpha-glucanotransferase